MKKVLAALTAAAIGTGALVAVGPSGIDGAAALDDLVAHHAGVHGSIGGPRTLADSLPNTKHATTGESASTAVARAHVSHVADGSGLFRPDPFDPASPEQNVTFDDERAQWRTLVVTLAVDEIIAGETKNEVTVRWLIAGPGASTVGVEPEDPKQIEAALRELGSALWLLRGDDFLADYGFTQVATVDSRRKLDFVFLPAEEEAAFVAGLDTVDKVMAKSREAERRASW